MDFEVRRQKPAKVWALVAGWFFTIVYFELIGPSRAISRCKWPGVTPDSTRVALIADPQLVDPHTYPGRNKLFEWFTEVVTDRYLAKNWRFIQHNIDPDATVFLGDLFDGGREWANPQWLEEYQRFNTIFPRPRNKRTVMNLPGNHDIGFGNTIVLSALDRFKAWFGPTSEAIDLHGHNIVLLDTISMSNTQNSAIYEPPFQFMDELSSIIEPGPVYLCTHVPLFRPLDSSCGRFRESERNLPYSKGEQYLTQINPELTQKILETIQPAVIFSGDDHDACHVVHTYTVDGVQKTAHEFTVKSMSMAMGIDAPGIQLLTLNPTGYETAICFQSHPASPAIAYLVATIATLVYIFYMNRRHLNALLPLAEIKGKRQRRGVFPWLKVGMEVGACVVTFFVTQWFLGRFMYGDL